MDVTAIENNVVRQVTVEALDSRAQRDEIRHDDSRRRFDLDPDKPIVMGSRVRLDGR